ncbi:MAG TPA: sulfotransferase domain-containing protein [Verrucomicrobiae bacterium]|nr:sulfotransferase domain-containing protein [Verrucomicrobiae bacterium]
MSFLVFASPKSGTTWLQRMLSAHPEAVCAESRPFGDYYDPISLTAPHLTLEKYTSILGQYFAPAVDGLKAADTGFYQTLLFNLIDTVAATTQAAVNKRVYGEKFTPYRGTAEQALSALREYHPGIKFVNLTRDGRDVIVSGAVQWLNLRLRQAPPGEREIFEKALRERTILATEFDMFLEYWIDAARAGLKAQTVFRHYLHLSYESLVADPMTQAVKLFQFLGLNSDPDLLGSCIRAAAFETLSGGRQCGQENNGSFFRKGVVGDWKNWFRAEQRDLFEQRAGTLLKSLGY